MKALVQALAAALLAACGVAPASAAPLAAYGNLPSIGTVKISPDGARLAIAASTDAGGALLVKQLSDGKTQAYGLGGAKLRGIDWLGPDQLVVTTSTTTTIPYIVAPRNEWMTGMLLDVTAGKLEALLAHTAGAPHLGSRVADLDAGKTEGALNVLAGPPQIRAINGVPTLFLTGVSFKGERGVLTVFRMDGHTARPAAIGDRYTSAYVLGANGAAAASTSYDSDSGRWALSLRQPDGAWKEGHVLHAKNEQPQLIGLGRDGRSVVVAVLEDQGYALHEVAPDGTWGEALPVKEIDSAIFDPETYRLIGIEALVGEEQRYTFFDPADQKAWDAVRAAFPKDRVRLVSWSRDRTKVVILADSPTEGPAYAMVDRTAKRAEWIGARYQKLQPQDIAPVEPLSFKAKDGLMLTGYLTRPNGRDAKNLPLIVFPHGGPAARDEPGFDWWAQAMASRGYAVLQVNFRGSEGFGWPFVQAGFGEWGRKMQTDLSDGVRYLAAKGTVDPKRVCIVGASYGGYAALAGAALDPGVYRCAVSVAGPSDLKRFVAWSGDRNGEEAFRYWTRFMGAQSGHDDVLTAISPAAHADQITAPVLLVHGQDDTVVPLEQSKIMADALRRAGKSVELVVEPGQDHWQSRGDTRLQTLEATMAFLEKNNPPH